MAEEEGEAKAVGPPAPARGEAAAGDSGDEEEDSREKEDVGEKGVGGNGPPVRG